MSIGLSNIVVIFAHLICFVILYRVSKSVNEYGYLLDEVKTFEERKRVLNSIKSLNQSVEIALYLASITNLLIFILINKKANEMDKFILTDIIILSVIGLMVILFAWLYIKQVIKGKNENLCMTERRDVAQTKRIILIGTSWFIAAACIMIYFILQR